MIYCYSLTNSKPQAEDIVQNTLIYIWTNRENLNIKISLKNYLYRAVYNNFVSEYKKQKRKDESLSNLKYETIVELINHDNTYLKKKLDLLEKAIEDLPEKCKKVFLMSK